MAIRNCALWSFLFRIWVCWLSINYFLIHVPIPDNGIKRRSNIYCSQRKIGTMYIHSCSACKRWKPMLSVEIILGGYNLNPAIDSEFCGKATSPFVLVFISAVLAFISLRIVRVISSVSFWSHNNLHVFYLTKIIILKYFIFNRWETNSH